MVWKSFPFQSERLHFFYFILDACVSFGVVSKQFCSDLLKELISKHEENVAMLSILKVRLLFQSF